MTPVTEDERPTAAPRTVAAVVLTRNRRHLLRESLTAVAAQTRPVDRLIVVDNASGDGTRDMLGAEHSDAEVVALAENQGATGGFCDGILAALGGQADWLWLMDDDCCPRPDALERLLAALARVGASTPVSLLSSRVEWRDGRPHPMNLPVIAHRDVQGLVDAVGLGLLPLRATTWVSLLLAREAVERERLPRRDFFYQADDIEYTARILRRARGLFVPESVVEHRTDTPATGVSDDMRFFYHARNSIFMLRGIEAWTAREKPALALWVMRSLLEYLRLNRFSARSLRTLAGALRAGLGASARTRPRRRA